MITEKEVSKKLRRILAELGIKYSKILLFGSRARIDFDEESDWDFFIILKKSVDLEKKKELWHKIYKKFHEYFPFVSVDIILKDVESFENEKTIVNTVSNEVYLEGVEI
ncbi:MAG: nucleotidyltransferase family protein [Candidatus Wukongarchaeota archaeon]|nr:nucleotidyltransferase domain-containing protein [Candidatus Wukongarchaeota archaeon]